MTREEMIEALSAAMMAINSVQVDLRPLMELEDPLTSDGVSAAWGELNKAWVRLYDVRQHHRAHLAAEAEEPQP